MHVSGCSKGCAFPRKADVTLVGNNGKIDVVLNVEAKDKPKISLLKEDLKNYKNLFN